MIDINADLGEGVGNEAALMPLLSSCNIACGGHAGTATTMETAVNLAMQYGVKIGAHPSFPDIENFGRREMIMSHEVLRDSIERQLQALLTVLKTCGAALHHVKPHGALYNKAAKDHDTASVIIEACKCIPTSVYIYVPYKSVIADVARAHGVPIRYEAFADRNYNSDLSLVSRLEPDAVITDEETVFQHVYQMISEGRVKTLKGEKVPIKADTYCIHGDQPEAVKLLKGLKTRLTALNIS